LKNANGECVRPENCEAQTLVGGFRPLPPSKTQEDGHLIGGIRPVPPHSEMQCPKNEEFNACGSACAPTCANPHPSPVCTRQCVIGCFCQPGYLRNKYHVCVPADKCGAPKTDMLFAYPPDFVVPTMPPQMCAENEEFRQCKGCDGTCDTPNPACPRICIPGCACKLGHVRTGSNGKCIKMEQCPKTDMLFAYPPDFVVPTVAPQMCAENEEFRQCKGCDGTCSNPNPPCPRICKPGCACKMGHVRTGSNGKCIKMEQCPKVDPVSFMMMPPVCGANEEFRTCGTACPATCANPHPSPVCTKNCVIGCFCKEGFLKTSNGQCVPAANCDMPLEIAAASRPYGNDIMCPNEHEMYIEDDFATTLDCMARCDTPLPFMIHGHPQIPKKCQQVKAGATCVCQKPFVRNHEGKCVERKQCDTTMMMTTPAH
jgi:hypothetical protein